MWIGHHKKIQKLMFHVCQVIALRWICSEEGLTLEMSFQMSLQWPIHIKNPAEKANYLVILPTDAAPQFL